MSFAGVWLRDRTDAGGVPAPAAFRKLISITTHDRITDTLGAFMAFITGIWR